MTDEPLASRSFRPNDQIAFARLSSDWNPMHLDEAFARRSQMGAPVVHGIHTLAWAADAVLQRFPFKIANIRAQIPAAAIPRRTCIGANSRPQRQPDRIRGGGGKHGGRADQAFIGARKISWLERAVAAAGACADVAACRSPFRRPRRSGRRRCDRRWRRPIAIPRAFGRDRRCGRQGAACDVADCRHGVPGTALAVCRAGGELRCRRRAAKRPRLCGEEGRCAISFAADRRCGLRYLRPAGCLRPAGSAVPTGHRRDIRAGCREPVRRTKIAHCRRLARAWRSDGEDRRCRRRTCCHHLQGQPARGRAALRRNSRRRRPMRNPALRRADAGERATRAAGRDRLLLLLRDPEDISAQVGFVRAGKAAHVPELLCRRLLRPVHRAGSMPDRESSPCSIRRRQPSTRASAPRRNMPWRRWQAKSWQST